MAMKFNRSFNINRVVKRLVRSVLALYVGGTVMTTFGNVMKCSGSPFYNGLTLIGWTVTPTQTVNSTAVITGVATACNATSTPAFISNLGASAGNNVGVSNFNVITATSGSGVLAVVGIIAIAQIITEFITW